MKNNIKTLSISALLYLPSAFIGNGFSPVFSVMKETRHSYLPHASLAIFFLLKLLLDITTGVLTQTLLLYPIWYICYLTSHKSAILSATTFYLLSNTLFFFTSTIYPPTLSGYTTCMLAGLPFYLRSLLATSIFSLIFLFLKKHHPSLLYYRA